MREPLRIAVVGHTNTGKTSLMRTLLRDPDFGEVACHPGTTRHVEQARLAWDSAGSGPVIELFDTPGLEDPIALLEVLEGGDARLHADGVDRVRRFVDGDHGGGRFEQEAKVLRQVLASHAALYVVDAREAVLPKYRDELIILGLCARPLVPVLNFGASGEARTAEWREQLSRLGQHAVAEFDTVVYNAEAEARLVYKLQSVLEPFHEVLDGWLRARNAELQALERAAWQAVGALLIDVAALRVRVPTTADEALGLERLRVAARAREQSCVDTLLDLYRFHRNDYAGDDLPLDQGRWALDLFDPEALRRFGIRTGTAAAAGGAAGVAVDAVTGGLTLGAAAALGASLGALWGATSGVGRQLLDHWRGVREVRVDDATLQLLAARARALLQALRRRGHAAADPLRPTPSSAALPAVVRRARHHPAWSTLNADLALEVAARDQAITEAATALAARDPREPHRAVELVR